MKMLLSSEIRRAYAELRLINDMEPIIQALDDAQLKAKTNHFKLRLQEGLTLESIRPEVFAVVREATLRVLKKRLFDVQILGGLILTFGSVAEMKTGEGKTITSLAPVFLHALVGKGVIVSTVNEYLTKRDAAEMGEVYQWLGLVVGVNLTDLSPSEKRIAYHSDITYSVHSEIGFDYLRDNMASRLEEKVQRGFYYALIDEVDSILIDEARTPLIISGGSTTPSQAYLQADVFAKSLGDTAYEIDWESKSISLTDGGVDQANKFFMTQNIFDVAHSELVHRITNALRANYTMFVDADYIVRDNKIEIVDSFTGRIMEGRSFSEGLHQAIEAKERVAITQENTTLATITYQNLFRMFKKLSGMSGTAKTEEDEFLEIYNMRVHVVPTHKPILRQDHLDEIYVTKEAKQNAVLSLIKRVHEKGQPILLGTEEVAESETYAAMLARDGIKHTVLNAKQNATEAEIIAQAGLFKSVTIATNMAGRGTDIKPCSESLAVGGLYVIGTNKAESRRIDNQLRGRSGRQGDPGESKFLLSLDDKLMTRFSSYEKLKRAFASFGDKPILNKRMVRALNRAQVRIEGFNFESRKQVLQYDDVIRQQRDLMYAQRDIIIGHQDQKIVIDRMVRSVVRDLITKPSFSTFRNPDRTIDVVKLATVLNNLWFTMTEFKLTPDGIVHQSNNELIESISKDAIEVYEQMRERMDENITHEGTLENERAIILATFDRNWQLHIDKMYRLKSATNLVSYAQKNPFQVYVERGAQNFDDLLSRISHNTVRQLFTNPNARAITNVQNNIVNSVIQSAIAKQQSGVASTIGEAQPVVTKKPDTPKP